MPKRTKVNVELLLAIYTETQCGSETARQMGIHENTVYQILKNHRGQCKRCSNPVNPGNAYCPTCQEHLRERMVVKRQERKRLGICDMCDNPVSPPSRTYCAEHRIRHLEQEVEAYKRKKRGAPNQGVRSKIDRERGLRNKYGAGGIVAWDRHNGCCSMCGVSYAERAIHIHHIDRDDTNHAPDNLIALCFTCHRLVHHLIDHPNPNAAFAWLRSVYPNLPW